MSAPRVNAVGDIVLTDPQAMRALAEPSRLALLDGLRREGPATAAKLSAEAGELAELERCGFVERSFSDRYRQIARPFDWTFTRTDLDRLLTRIDTHEPELRLAA